MINNLKIIKAQLENEQVAGNQTPKTNKKNVQASKQNNGKQKNKTRNVSTSETG